MPQMTDPSHALASFQQALSAGELQLQRGQLDREVWVLLDHPTGSPRFAYVRVDKGVVTAFVVLASVEPIDGMPCFQIGYAVPAAYQNQGRAKDLVRASLAELSNGLARAGIDSICIEAVVGENNEPSKRVASKVLSAAPTKIIDQFSGLDALHYVRIIETSPTRRTQEQR